MTDAPDDRKNPEPPKPGSHDGAPPPRDGLVDEVETVDEALTADAGVVPSIGTADRLLRGRGRILELVLASKPAALAWQLLLMAAIGGSLYGLAMGAYTGGEQYGQAAAKGALLLVGTIAIVLPSFYVFGILFGLNIPIRFTAPILLLLPAAAALVLASLAPISWFFTVSAGGYEFMRALHIAFLAAAAFCGFSFLTAAVRSVPRPLAARAFFGLWLGTCILVGLQMSAALSPFLGKGETFFHPRASFLQVWDESEMLAEDEAQRLREGVGEDEGEKKSEGR